MQLVTRTALDIVKTLLISCCCLVDVLQLSPEYRKAEPGMFNLLFGAYGEGSCLPPPSNKHGT
jgi:hypothetical protein